METVLAQCDSYLTGFTLEDRLRRRSEILACTAEQVRECGKELVNSSKARYTVVLASRELIEGSEREFTVEELG